MEICTYNICVDFHIMHIHEIGVQKISKYRYHASFVCVQFSRGMGRGVGEKRLVFVSKKILVFTDDPIVNKTLSPNSFATEIL